MTEQADRNPGRSATNGAAAADVVYQGMRWLKCDLQVQTPEDAKHWADPDLRLGEPRRPRAADGFDEGPLQEKARTFLRQCHALQLDVIGVTDHNFSRQPDARDWFLTHLVEQNPTVAMDCGRAPLVIFPGFEIDIGYHVLCLFAPAVKVPHLHHVNHCLLQLGLAPGERFTDGKPQPLRFNNRARSLKDILEIVQGKYAGIVICAHADQKDGLLHDGRHQADYLLDDLLCIELTQHPPRGRFDAILNGNEKQWARRRLAVVQSSGAKSLATDDAGRPAPNALGYRYTWISMSEPSIESLRQAFLDPGSRIRLRADLAPDQRPEATQTQARILSLAVREAAFVADQAVAFSPNLNCIIGGRGSGKSTLIEYLRVSLGQESAGALADHKETRDRIERIKQTITPDTRISVVWQDQAGVREHLCFDPVRRGPVSADRDLIDPVAFFANLPVRFFSQKQLSALTDRDTNGLLGLLDEFVREELTRLDVDERETRRHLEHLLQQRRDRSRLDAELRRVSQELADLDRQWQARAGLQDAAATHAALQEEARQVQRVRADYRHPESWLELARDFAEGHGPLGSTADHWPHREWFQTLDAGVETAKVTLLAQIEQAVSAFQRTLADALDNDPQWPLIGECHANAAADFARVCAERGLTGEQVGQLQQVDRQRTAKRTELQLKQAELDQLEQALSALDAGLVRLAGIWRAQWQARRAAAERAERVGTERQTRFLEIQVGYCADEKGFADIWSALRPRDGRGRLAKLWDEFGQRLLQHAINTNADAALACLEAMFDGCEEVPAELSEQLAEVASHLRGPEMQAAWDRARLTRVPDLVDLTLYRADGSRAGSVRRNELSDGQRNTAALALLLAQGGGPLIIDQPEEELDASFIYSDLVPMLRREKIRRQLIFATHDANLPVNGDAELVYALEARDGRGQVRAQGGLDSEQVTQAVLDIMEGSREAFERRRDKYRF